MSGELALYRAILAALLIAVYLPLTKRRIPLANIKKGKLESAQKTASIWEQRYEKLHEQYAELKKEAQPFLDAPEIASERVRAFLDVVLGRGMETRELKRSALRRERAMDRSKKGKLRPVTNRNQQAMPLPIDGKVLLAIREAAEYSNIGINKIDEMPKQPGCTFVLCVSTKKLVKRKAFKEFIESRVAI